MTKPFDNTRAYLEGWALFNDGNIQRIDNAGDCRPANCECDDTHEASRTCCMPCWALGYRSVATEPMLTSNDAALALVHVLAKSGSEYHKRALRVWKRCQKRLPTTN